MKSLKNNIPFVFSIIFVLSLFILTSCSITHSSMEKFNSDVEIYTSSVYESVTVDRVVDGDTIVVKTSNNAEYRVRLIGIDTPESVHPDKSKNSYAGKIASEFTKSLLPEGTALYLEKDVSNTDQYGRLLRYVWLKVPSENPSTEEISKYMVNAILVEKGYAKTVVYEPDTKYITVFKEIENQTTQKEAA